MSYSFQINDVCIDQQVQHNWKAENASWTSRQNSLISDENRQLGLTFLWFKKQLGERAFE